MNERKNDPMNALERMNAIRAMSEALAKIDASFLEEHRRRTGKPFFSVHNAARAINIVREPGEEIWRDVSNIVSSGRASLADIACWRIAELRASGKDAAPMIVVGEGGAVYVKIRIDDEDGVVHIEDPADIAR